MINKTKVWVILNGDKIPDKYYEDNSSNMELKDSDSNNISDVLENC